MDNAKQGTVNIRPITHSDIRAVLALDRKYGQECCDLSYKGTASIDPGRPLDVSFIAEIGDKMIGFVIARLAYLLIPSTGVCIIQGILVDPDYQSRGIGSNLLGELIKHCEDKGISTIGTRVEEHNDKLRHFVERLGFHRGTNNN